MKILFSFKSGLILCLVRVMQLISQCLTWWSDAFWLFLHLRFANQFLCWLEMAVSPLALWGFQSSKQISQQIMSPKTDNVRYGYGPRLKPNSILARSKKKMSKDQYSWGTVPPAADGVWKLLRDLALIKVRSQRKWQLAPWVFFMFTRTTCVLLLKFYFMYTVMPWTNIVPPKSSWVNIAVPASHVRGVLVYFIQQVKMIVSDTEVIQEETRRLNDRHGVKSKSPIK